jgi:hypothetical protein
LSRRKRDRVTLAASMVFNSCSIAIALRPSRFEMRCFDTAAIVIPTQT